MRRRFPSSIVMRCHATATSTRLAVLVRSDVSDDDVAACYTDSALRLASCGVQCSQSMRAVVRAVFLLLVSFVGTTVTIVLRTPCGVQPLSVSRVTSEKCDFEIQRNLKSTWPWAFYYTQTSGNSAALSAQQKRPKRFRAQSTTDSSLLLASAFSPSLQSTCCAGRWARSVRECESKLCIWRKAGPEEDAGAWTQNMSIELEELLPRGAILETSPYVAGFADGISVIFLQAGHILFTVDLKNYKVKNVCKGKGIYTAIPYTRASTPLVQVYLDYNIQND